MKMESSKKKCVFFFLFLIDDKIEEKENEKFTSSDHHQHHSISQHKISYCDENQNENNNKISSLSSSSSSQQYQLTNDTTPSQNNNHPQQSNRIISLKDYFIAPDRPKSIDNCFLSPTPLSSVKEFRFFDEIEKISHNLFKITVPGSTSNIQQSVVNIDNNNTNTLNHGNGTEEEKCRENLTIKQMMNEESNVNLTATNLNSQSIDENNNKDVESHWKLYDKEGGLNLKNQRFAEILNRLTSPHFKSESIAPIVHWPVSNRRIKYKVNQMSSRDVPIINDKKPAKLQKQNAVDKVDEQTDKVSLKICEKFISSNYDRDENLINSQLNQKFFIYNSNSIDCGQLNSFRSIFELHASTGQTVKKIQASFESKK